MSNKTYVLLKDSIDAKAGDEFVYDSDSCIYGKSGVLGVIYYTCDVENNPEWFKLKEESIRVTGIYKNEHPQLGHCFNFTVDKDICLIIEEKYSAICKAIEFVINETH